MKRVSLFIALFIVGMLAKTAKAYEIPNNPDRRMSFGFNYARFNSNGDYNQNGANYANSETLTQNSFLFDLRAPIANWLTFSAGAGLLTSNAGFNPVNGFNETVNMSGPVFNVGFRVYIP